jgi:putative peptidoglycan lipid II flippase
MRTPVRIAIGVLLATQLMNLLFVPWFGHAGLALSISVGALGNAGFLLFGLMRRGVYRPRPGWLVFGAQILAGCLVLGLALGWADRAIAWIDLRAQAPLRAAWMALVLPASALLYFGVLALCGLKPRQFVRRA